MSYYAIDFERPYVSPYLRRRCRSLEEVLSEREALRKDADVRGWGGASPRQQPPKESVDAMHATTTRQPVLKPGPLSRPALPHHAQPKGGE
jgi:hypothetical protein